VGFLPTLLSLHRRWSNLDEAYSHGYLLLLLALYLFSQHSPQKRAAHTASRYLSLACIIVMAATSLGWLLFYLAGITAAQQLAMPLLVACSAGAVGGSAALRRAAVPCTLMYLAIPVWDELLTTPLQTLSTAVAGWTIRHLFGIAVSIEGFHIHIPAGVFEIQGGCAGLVFLLTALTLGVAYGQLYLHSTRARWTGVLIAAVLGVIVNWIRIISLILIGHYTAMRSPLIGEGHLMFGFYIFGSIALTVIFLASRFSTAAPATSPAIVADDHAATPTPNVRTRNLRTHNNFSTLLTLAALALGPLTLMLLRGIEPAPAPLSLSAPATIGSNLTRSDADWNPDFPGASMAASYRYAADNSISVHLVYFPNPFGNGKLVSQSNHPLPASWKTQQRTLGTLENGDPVLQSRVVDDQARALLVWSWYQIGDDIVAAESAARLVQLRNATHLRLDGSFVSIATYCIFPDCALSENTLQRSAVAIRNDISTWAVTVRNQKNQ